MILKDLTPIMLTPIMILFVMLSSCSLYSAGPWRGRVIDADSKQPIEGAVVTAIWERKYDCGFSRPLYFQAAQEVLTDNDGKFKIPPYKEEKGKAFWRAKDNLNDPLSLLICTGPVINDPQFIIYKPCYWDYPQNDALRIYPLSPGSSKVEYYEFHKKSVKGQEIEWAEKKTIKFPEGLVYDGQSCQARISAIAKTLSFEVRALFVPMANATSKAEKLEIPLDCPDGAEPVPRSMHEFRDDTVSPLYKNGGFIIVELSKRKQGEKRVWNSVDVPGTVEYKAASIPLLYQALQTGCNQ